MDRSQQSWTRPPAKSIPAASPSQGEIPGPSHRPDPTHVAGETQLAFARFRLDSHGVLSHNGSMLQLPAKELAALRLLLAHAGEIVTIGELRQELPGAANATAESVPKVISSLRTMLKPENCIQTVPRRGYRFSAEVTPCPPAVTSAPPRLAIMPFVTGFALPEHLGFVVAEETSTRLASLSGGAVAVLARDSVFTLASQGRTAQQVGEALNADLVLTGSLSSLPSCFRLRAEMIRVEDGSQIWVEDILAPKDRTAGLESEMTDRLLARLGVGGIGISAAGDETVAVDREAYEAFQKAHFEWQTLQRHQMQDGLQHLFRVTEIAPALMAAKVDLVHLCVTQAIYGFMSPAVAADLVHRTVESVPGGADETALLPALGWVDFHWDRDLPAAISAFSASAHLPHNPWDTRARIMFAVSRRRFSEALSIYRIALSLDPYSPWLQAGFAWALHLAGRAKESVEQARMALSLFPGQETAHLYGAMIFAFNGDAEYAVSLAESLVQRLPFFDLAFAVQAYALACAGRHDEAGSILERLQWLSRERFVLRSFTPAAYLAIGDRDSALAELRIADETRCPWFFPMLADPRLGSLEGDPEFESMQSTLARLEAAAPDFTF